MSALTSPSPRSPVLVLDGDQPSALAVVRSLARAGLQVHVASSQAAPLAGHSRHAARVLRHPDPLSEEDAFIAWLAPMLDPGQHALVIPVTERTVVPMLRHRHRLREEALALAPSAALEQALDKDQTVRLAQALGIAVPRSRTLEDLALLPEAVAELGFPVVVKPARSVGHGSGRRVQLSVSYARDAAELQALVREALRHGAVILQEFFRGDGVGIELIADRGAVQFAFQHKRLHEVPLTGGGSSLRISEMPVPVLLDASRQLMRAMGWHGVAMVEFKYQPDTGAYRLMEINGRFWGSLPLAVAAGADFPVMLHELMTTGSVAPRPPARVGVVCRQLSRDIDWLEHVLRRAAPPQLARLPTKAEVLRDSLLVLSPRHHFDVQSWRDPRPGLVDLARIARRQWTRLATIVAFRRRLRQERSAGRHDGDTMRRVRSARQVLFLCYGNINRSALAHAAAAARHPGARNYSSAGFHAPAGRAADAVMVETAAADGVDLRGWQSRTLDAAMVGAADVILAMEVAHLDRLFEEYPSARGKAFLLGAATATGPGDTEVQDPYGKSPAVYRKICRQVLACLDGWFGRPQGR